MLFLIVGIFVIPTLPYIQLDAVLSGEELDNDALRESTLALLKKASGNQWALWALGGVAQLAIGVLGLRANNLHDVEDVASNP